MLREDDGAVGGFDMGAEVEDIGEGGGGHVEEDVLHVDDDEGCGHGGQTEWVVRDEEEEKEIERY